MPELAKYSLAFIALLLSFLAAIECVKTMNVVKRNRARASKPDR